MDLGATVFWFDQRSRAKHPSVLMLWPRAAELSDTGFLLRPIGQHSDTRRQSRLGTMAGPSQAGRSVSCEPRMARAASNAQNLPLSTFLDDAIHLAKKRQRR